MPWRIHLSLPGLPSPPRQRGRLPARRTGSHYAPVRLSWARLLERVFEIALRRLSERLPAVWQFGPSTNASRSTPEGHGRRQPAFGHLGAKVDYTEQPRPGGPGRERSRANSKDGAQELDKTHSFMEHIGECLSAKC